MERVAMASGEEDVERRRAGSGVMRLVYAEIVTNNTSHFSRIPGLAVRNWLAK